MNATSAQAPSAPVSPRAVLPQVRSPRSFRVKAKVAAGMLALGLVAGGGFALSQLGDTGVQSVALSGPAAGAGWGS